MWKATAEGLPTSPVIQGGGKRESKPAGSRKSGQICCRFWVQSSLHAADSKCSFRQQRIWKTHLSEVQLCSLNSILIMELCRKVDLIITVLNSVNRQLNGLIDSNSLKLKRKTKVWLPSKYHETLVRQINWCLCTKTPLRILGEKKKTWLIKIPSKPILVYYLIPTTQQHSCSFVEFMN